MKSFNDDFQRHIISSNKNSRWYAEISLDDENTDLVYFTSHKDIPIDVNDTVVHESLADFSSISQRVDVEKFNSKIGSMTLQIVNINDEVDTILRDKNNNDKTLFGKRVRLYWGAKGLALDKYIRKRTQWVSDEVSYNQKVYTVPCEDAQQFLDKVVFKPLTTRLSSNIDENATSIPGYDFDGWSLISRGADFGEAPSTICNFLEISGNKRKEFCRVTATASAQATVVRKALGSESLTWEIPAEANSDKGPKIKELITVDMNCVEFAWAFLTREDLNNPGTNLFPEHWSCSIPTSYFVRDEWLELAKTNKTKAQRTAIPKSNGKQFFEEHIMPMLGHYLRVNGDGVMNLRAIHAIHDDASVVGTITENDSVTNTGLKHSVKDVINFININWSWDERASTPQYRRTTPFQIDNSVNKFGKKEKTISLGLLNASTSSSSVLLSIANAILDQQAGDQVFYGCTTLKKLARFEAGDVVRVEASSNDYTGAGKLARAMMIIEERLSKNSGISFKFKGSAFVASPITDGDVRAMTDASYSSVGSAVANVSTNVLTNDTTLIGTTNVNDAASTFYVDGNLTIPSDKILSYQGNVFLKVKGVLTIESKINGVGNGRTAGAGFIGTSEGGTALQRDTHASHVETTTIRGSVIEGQHDAFPTLNLVNNDGTSVSGVPDDLRGTFGATGATAVLYDHTSGEDEPNEDARSEGAIGNVSGSGLVIMSRGVVIQGAGAIDSSGLPGNDAVPDGDTIGGKGGHSTPGGILFLMDGSTSPTPNLNGTIIANSNNPDDQSALDIKQAAARIQFIPQNRTETGDDPIDDGEIERQYSIDGATNWHFPIQSGDVFFRERVGSGAWSDAFGLKGDTGQDGVDGTGSLNLGRRSNKLAHWYRNGSQTQTLLSEFSVVNDSTAPIWDTVIRGQNNDDIGENVFSEKIPLDLSRKYRVSAEVRQTAGDRKNYLLVAFYDENGTNITDSTSDATGWTSRGTFHYHSVANAVFPASWTRYEFEFGGDAVATIPTNAKSMAIGGLFMRDGAVGTDTTVEFQDMHVIEVPQTGEDGQDGVDANGIEYIFAKYNSITLPASKNPDNAWGYDSPSTIDGLQWFDDAPELDVTDPYLFRAQRKITGAPAVNAAITDNWTTPKAIGRYGADGQNGEDGYSNLLDIEQWVIGTTGTQGDFAQNGAADENSIILDTSPYGESEAVWLCKTNNAADSGTDGGWNNNISSGDYDSTKTYRYSVWAKQSSTNGSVYLGCQDAFNIDLTANTNPYFWSGDLPVLDKWYLIVGVLHGSSYTGATSNISGVYDPSTGLRVIGGTDFICDPANSSQRHRAYWYYSTDTNAQCRLCRPRLDQVNGNEPTLFSMFFQAGFRNFDISIGNDGLLIGAGGGQVTIGGLGFLGEMDATRGARWGIDLFDRPIELTDGRVGGTLIGTGQLASGTGVQQGSGSSVYRNSAMGLDAQFGRHNDAIDFVTAWDSIPVIKFSAGGLSRSSSLSNDQFQDIKAINVSTSGFTISAQLKELAGSVVEHTDTGATAGTQDFEIHKSQAAQAFDDNYTFQYDVTIKNEFDNELGTWFGGIVTVGIYTNDGSGWVKRSTITHNAGFNPGQLNTVQSNQTATVTVDGLTNHGGTEFGINIESDSVGGSTLNFDSVKYTTATDPATADATPAGAPDIQYFVLGGG